MIRIENLHKNFKENIVLNDIDLKVKPNNVTTIVGPNGSGKTTIIKCILGMLIPKRGKIYIDNINISKSHTYRNYITYLPQVESFPPNLKVHELLDMIKNLRNNDISYLLLVNHFNLKQYLQHRTSTLSKGTRQKINLVITFMFDCPIIILDEPTAGLDPISVIKLKELIDIEKKKGKTILITSHIMSFIDEVSSEIILLSEGQIFYNGSIKKLKKNIVKNRNNKKSYLTDLEYALTKIIDEKNV